MRDCSAPPVSIKCLKLLFARKEKKREEERRGEKRRKEEKRGEKKDQKVLR